MTVRVVLIEAAPCMGFLLARLNDQHPRCDMLVYSGGTKGGVGKSVISMLALDYHLRNDSMPHILIETDTGNPDVWLTYAADVKTSLDTHEGKRCEVYTYSLDTENGRRSAMKLVSQALKEAPERTVILNAGARDHDSVMKLRIVLSHLPLLTFWTINAQETSIPLLKSYLDMVGSGKICVVKNGYFGEPCQFEFFDRSKLGQRIPAVYLECAHDLTMHYMTSGRFALHELEDGIDSIDWWMSEDWVCKARETYADAYAKAVAI